jgi:hypothetical protein
MPDEVRQSRFSSQRHRYTAGKHMQPYASRCLRGFGEGPLLGWVIWHVEDSQSWLGNKGVCMSAGIPLRTQQAALSNAVVLRALVLGRV